MELGDQNASGNVEDRRGMGIGMGGGLGIGRRLVDEWTRTPEGRSPQPEAVDHVGGRPQVPRIGAGRDDHEIAGDGRAGVDPRGLAHAPQRAARRGGEGADVPLERRREDDEARDRRAADRRARRGRTT